MKRKELKRYLDRQWKKTKHQLKICVAGTDKEALHRFRVQVKKIKAFVTLVSETAAVKGLKKSFRPIRNVFRKAGTIRDAQLRITLGKSQKAGRDFIARQQRLIYENTRRFHLQGKSHLKLTSRSYQKIKNRVKSIPDKAIRIYYKEQLRWIAKYINGGTALLHPCRKRIKTLIYNYKFAQDTLKQHLDIAYLKAMEKAIGNWHDNYLACRIFPALQTKERDLIDRVQSLSKDFYRRATV